MTLRVCLNKSVFLLSLSLARIITFSPPRTRLKPPIIVRTNLKHVVFSWNLKVWKEGIIIVRNSLTFSYLENVAFLRNHVSSLELLLHHSPHSIRKVSLYIIPTHAQQTDSSDVIFRQLFQYLRHAISTPLVLILQRTQENLHGSCENRGNSKLNKIASLY